MSWPGTWPRITSRPSPCRRFRRIEATGQAFTRPADFNPETCARQPSYIVDFALLRRGNAWVPYDVVIDDVSIVGNYRTQFDKVIRDKSYEDLVKKMRLKREAEGLGSTAKKGSM